MADGTAKTKQADPIADPTARLYAAIAEAQRVARGVEKSSVNPFHRYHYAGTEAMILEAKDAMAQTGLALVIVSSRIYSDGTRLEGEKGKEREAPQHFIASRWRVLHKDGGSLDTEEVCWPIVPEKGRPLDKATAAARTASLGYMLRDVLMLARVEEGTDLDHPSRDDRSHHDDDRDAGPPPPRDSRPPPASHEQRTAILDALEAQGIKRAEASAEVQKIVGHAGPLTKPEADRVLKTIKERAR